MKRGYKFWTTKDLAKFAELYADHGNNELAKIFGRTAVSLNNKAVKLGLKKSEHFLKTQSGRFDQKTAGWNRGKSFRPAGSEKTYFKAGQLPHNTQPLGAERIDRDGILWRKVAETRQKHKDWKRVKDLVFVEHFGPIPAGKFVVHANRDKLDFTPSNLIAITQAENAQRNINREKQIESLKKSWAKKNTPAFAKFVNVALDFANNPLPPLQVELLGD
jgi:hypothetical protein